ncbi:MAG TPA: hypothetical protein VFZ66_14630 [Herpetosiphonaceae bacterium]
MQPEPLPNLQLVALERCVLHESTDPARVSRLMNDLAREDVLRNPPIVARYARTDRLMVLDGATRTTAMGELGFEAIPVQIVNYVDSRIELHTWAHLLHNINTHSLLRALRALDQAKIYAVDAQDAERSVRERALLGALISSDGDAWAIEGGAALSDEAHLLETVFRCYAQRSTIQRLPHDERLTPASLPVGTIAVIFRHYTKLDLLELTNTGGILPAGITRHIIPGRVLRLNTPLSMLRSATFAAQQNWFAAWVAERIASGHARLYNEPTWLFDE